MIPVILSGGSGTRLWPASRPNYPKQFCEFFDSSLYAKTAQRLRPLGVPWTITNAALKTLTERELNKMSLSGAPVFYEPFQRNTAAAVALLCKHGELHGQTQDVVGVFPADQIVGNEAEFLRAVNRAEEAARAGEIVTIGIRPTFAATGFGYIEVDNPRADSESPLRHALRFHEKPNATAAQAYLESGRFFWNSGMFIFRVDRMISCLREFVPDIWAHFDSLYKDHSNLAEIYAGVREISLDYAVMERLSGHTCLVAEFGWDDVGSWDAIAKLDATKTPKAVVGHQAEGNYVRPCDNKAYALVGVDDLIVIDTPDALLISKKGASESVKVVLDAMKAADAPAAKQHAFDVRPWGSFEILRDASDFKSKRILVNPGAQISYQSHAQRSEHWIIVKGVGEVILDDKTIPIRAESHVHIPTGAKHRIRNTGSGDLEFVEVQLGTYFGEDDIVRYDDDYQRA